MNSTSLKIIRLLSLALISLALSSSAALRINEFMASNDETLQTAAGDFADWIELYNSGSEPVDLTGWFLSDSAKNLTKWQFPDGVTIDADSYLIIFADSSDESLINGELHTSFSLSKDGEYLGLIMPDGETVVHDFAPTFPIQFDDISYGISQKFTKLVDRSSPLRYRRNTYTGVQPWSNGSGGLGFSEQNGAFNVKFYRMNGTVNNVNTAESMVADRTKWYNNNYPVVGSYEIINFHENGVGGNFLNDLPFPSMTSGQTMDDYVVVAETTLYVPEAGYWSFCTGSDDGFRMRLSGHGYSFLSEYPGTRSFASTISQFNLPVAGFYTVYLIFFERGGGASLEFSAAKGDHTEFSAEHFKLVGDPTSELLHAGAINAHCDINVWSEIGARQTNLEVEWNFELDQAPASGDQLLLSIRVADGFAAKVNGTEIARLNAPKNIVYNSIATNTRNTLEAVTPVEFLVPASMLTAGSNTLYVVGLNDDYSDKEFLIQPNLYLLSETFSTGYFRDPTPGSGNRDFSEPPTPPVIISEPRGYRTEPFTTTITCPDSPSATIRYTLDGSTPSLESTIYTAPLTITQTTTLRAAVVTPDTILQRTATTTWLFLEDILQQSSSPPPGWPASKESNDHVMYYGMSQTIVNNDPIRLRQGMTNAIATISLVTDLDHLFHPQNGVYVNPYNHGWEVPASIELIDPVRGSEKEFQINAGIRIRGAFSRSKSNPKHSLRLFFRSIYGASRLQFPLFDEEGASEFARVDLRTSQNYAWSWQNSSRNTMVREVFSRDSQREMEMPYTRSRYYHLYINGIYWGVYQTQERAGAHFAASYFGGEKADWDCIKTAQPGYVTEAADGNFDAYHALHAIAINQGFEGANANNYWRVLGKNPDGSRNPDYPIYLDQDNLICYILSYYLTADSDSPLNSSVSMSNNLSALFNRKNPTGFIWLRHDAEHSLGTGFSVTTDVTKRGENLTSQGYFNPATLHLRLMKHPEYKLRFADLVQKHLLNYGVLTPENSKDIIRSRMDQIDLAIIAESARWGVNGHTRDGHWLPECNSVLNFLNARRDNLVTHIRNNGWLPATEAPALSTWNPVIQYNSTIKIGANTTFYYTTDGSDPRLPNGSINPTATPITTTHPLLEPQTLISRGATWRYYDKGHEPPNDGTLIWRDPAYNANLWQQGPAILGFAGATTVNSVATTTKRYVTGNSGPQVTTTYFRHNFTLASTNDIAALAIELLRDDGAILYLNGAEILRDNMPSGTVSYNTYSSNVAGSPAQNTYYNFTRSFAHLLRNGENVLALELHQCNSGSSDLYLDMRLTGTPPDSDLLPFRTELILNSDTTIMARALSGAEWSPLVEGNYQVIRPENYYHPLRISEMMYAPVKPPSGSPYANDDFAWLELRNTGSWPIDLAGVQVAEGIDHTFSSSTLYPGARLVLAKNPTALAQRHDTSNMNLVAWTKGNLARKGETLALLDPDGNNILTFTYSNEWYPNTYNTDLSIVAIDLLADEPLWSTAANWRPGHTLHGAAGRPDNPLLNQITLGGTGTSMTISTLGVDGTPELWWSDDLKNWSPCPANSCQFTPDSVVVDLLNPGFSAAPQRFFKLQIIDTENER